MLINFGCADLKFVVQKVVFLLYEKMCLKIMKLFSIFLFLTLEPDALYVYVNIFFVAVE